MQVNSANGNYNYGGMSLRDWLAGQALAGTLANHEIMAQINQVSKERGQDITKTTAQYVLEFADDLIAVRKETK